MPALMGAAEVMGREPWGQGMQQSAVLEGTVSLAWWGLAEEAATSAFFAPQSVMLELTCSTL